MFDISKLTKTSIRAPLAIGLTYLAILFSGPTALAQAPEIGGLVPSGGPRGTATRIEIDGKSLGGAKLWVYGKGITVRSSTVAPAGDRITAEVVVEPGAPLGPHDVRIATAKGVSNGARFWVDVLPNRVFAKPLSSGSEPELIDGKTPSIVNSRIPTKAGRDRFLINASAGEVWTFQCRADAIRSRIDPVLELNDESGVSLRLVQGAWEGDPAFAYKFEKSGKYVLTVRDSEYNGGPNYTYRLLAARTPFVDSFLPRGGKPGQTIDVKLHGTNLASERTAVAIPPDATGTYWESIRSGSSDSVMLPFLLDIAPAFDAGDQGTFQQITAIPAVVDGAFGRSPQAKFGLHLAAGSKVLLDLLGRRIGSRIDGSLSVQDASGKELAVNDDAEGLGKDARLEFTAPATADYQIEVRNVEEITGPDCYYRLDITPIVPDFQIALATDRIAAPIGGTISIPITLERLGGFNGPVQAIVTGLPAGVICRGGYFGPGKNAAELTVTVPPEVVVTSADVQVRAEAMVEGKRMVREAPAWERYEHRSIDLLLSVEYSYTRPHHLWDLLLLAVTDRTDPITISSSVTDLALTAGSRIEIPVHVLRHPGANGEVKLDVRGLPGKVTAAGVTIPANMSDGTLVLTAAPDAAAEVVDLIVQGHLGNSVVLLPAVRLTVAKK